MSNPYGRLVALLQGCCLLALSACSPHAYERIAADDSRIRYVGRFHAVEHARVSGWPGTQIEARFTGPSIAAVLTEMPTADEIRDHDRIRVTIDGGAPRELALAEGRHVYPLARGLDAGEHHVQLWKQTEGVVGAVAFEGFLLARGQMLLAAPAEPKRRIEMVGDSITAGYGNEGTSAACHWDAALENNYLTYGAFAARELGAAYSAIAWSGKGILRNYDPNEPETLPEIYERVLPADASAGSAPASPRPDAVVVNLGTNDIAASIPDGPSFERGYLALLSRVRARYPEAVLVIALGPMLADDAPQPRARSLMREWLKNVQAAWRAKRDERIAFIELWIDPAEGLGCDSHPSIRTHARMGVELAALLRTRLQW
jgi:lysophospholipase L1-like esterase